MVQKSHFFAIIFCTRQLLLILDHVVFRRLFIHFIFERKSNCIRIDIDLRFTIHRVGVGDSTVKPHLPTNDDIWEQTDFIMGKENHLTSFETKKTNYFSENCLKRFLSTEQANECVSK